MLTGELENRFSNWNTYVHVFKNINIFRFSCTGISRPSSTNEFQYAEKTLIKEIQKKYYGNKLTLLKKNTQPKHHLDLYLDKDGLIRCRGSL